MANKKTVKATPTRVPSKNFVPSRKNDNLRSEPHDSPARRAANGRQAGPRKRSK